MVYFHQAKMYLGVNSENACFRCYTGSTQINLDIFSAHRTQLRRSTNNPYSWTVVHVLNYNRPLTEKTFHYYVPLFTNLCTLCMCYKAESRSEPL